MATLDSQATLAQPDRRPLVVETYKDGQLESVRTIYLKSKRNREWLAKHEYWAIQNKRTIILQPVGMTHIFDYPDQESAA